ncbi:cytochrome P450 [Cladochytrium replicatum]|nr:cytochrome P450 [Cladochytrium replicatum]
MTVAEFLATILVTVVIVLTLAIIFDPSVPAAHADGRKLNRPPTVPWTFILPRMGNISDLFIDARKKYGDIVSIHFPFKGMLILALGNKASHWFHTASLNDLNDTTAIFREWVFEFPEKLSTPDILKAFVRSLNPDFYKNVVLSLQDILQERVSVWAKGSEQGTSFDIFDQGHNIVLDLNTKVMFGNDWNEGELEKFKKAFITSDPAFWISNPIYLLFPWLGRRQRTEANQVIIETAIRQAEKHQKQGLNPDQCSLDFFLTEQSPTLAAALCYSLELSSFITTSFAASWLVYHLASDMELQQRVRAEMESLVPAGEKLTVEHLSKMHFTDSLVREVIRMHSHGPNARSVLNDMKYGDIDIPRGSSLVMPLVTLHFNEENYPDSSAFKPDRFLNEEGQLDVTAQNRACTFVVFGAGRHPCLGMRLATTELKVLAYELLRAHDIKVVNKPSVPFLKGMGFENPSVC